MVTSGVRGVRRIAVVGAIAALALGACSSSASPNASQGPVTLHALFMKQAAYSEASPKHPVFVALAETVRQFDIPRHEFSDLRNPAPRISGREC